MRDVSAEEFLRILQDLSTLGPSLVEICRASGIRLATLRAAGGRIPANMMVRAFAGVEGLTGDLHVGLHAGQHAALNHVVAISAASQPTLRQAIEQYCRFQPLLLGTEALTPRVGSTSFRLVISRGSAPDAMRHLSEYYTMAFVRECVAIAGSGARPLEIHFCHAPIGPVTEYERRFGCPVRFRADEGMLVLSLQATEILLPTANAHIARILSVLAEEQLALMRRQTVSERAADAIRTALQRTGDAHCGQIARELAMSARTLQRRLGDEGRTFRSLRDVVRRDLALEITDEATQAGPPSVNDLAASVGFANSAGLCRAFHRWTGTSLSAYRSRRRQRDASRHNPLRGTLQ